MLSDIDAQEFYDEPTVLRMLVAFDGYVKIQTGFNNALNWAVEIRMGIIVCRADFADPNLPQIMNLDDYSLDWLYHRVFQQYHLGGDVISYMSRTHGGDHGFVDVRAKRKVPEGFGVAMCIQSSDETNAPTDTLPDFVYSTQGRMLLADH